MCVAFAGTYDWASTLSFLARRAVDGVEQVVGGVYQRSIADGTVHGVISVEPDTGQTALVVSVAGSQWSGPTITQRARLMFDLDVDAAAIAAHLASDPMMHPLVTTRPPLRVFRGWDRFEVAMRSIVGQQVTVERARQLNSTLVARCGTDISSDDGHGIRKLFPTADQVLNADLTSMGMPGARVETLRAVAAAAIADPSLFERGSSLDETVERLRRIRGIGDWTAHYIAMRACGEPDAFPASDIGLLRGAADARGRRPTPVELLRRAERWRPWRAYAAHYSWAHDGTRK
jgi:AraC family transcriptional regulator of adaptative response / DNA-3-methyladenine glycosylase II